ncbi:Uncharacterized protein DAT39_011256, partial [Clarias magur]
MDDKPTFVSLRWSSYSDLHACAEAVSLVKEAINDSSAVRDVDRYADDDQLVGLDTYSSSIASAATTTNTTTITSSAAISSRLSTRSKRKATS